MGISVLIPFIGAAIVTLPVFMIAVLQFGWSFDLAWVMLAMESSIFGRKCAGAVAFF